MKLLLLHLSDIHFKSDKDPILGRVGRITGAVKSVDLDIDARFLVVTGDIAHSGDPAQYELALDFFTRLKTSIHEIDSTKPSFCIYVPGNHDCDFGGEHDARQSLINTLGSSITKLKK